jgi:DNA polymerase
MPDELTPEQLARAIQHQLASLASAGIEYLPKVSAPAGVSLFTTAAPQISAPAAEPVDPLVERRHELTVLSERVSQCTRCPELASTRTQTVFGVGRFDPELCLIGEAPGADEDAQGEPFVGAAGQLLNRILAACGFKREDVYICNIIKCRPPQNRTPDPTEAEHCNEYLLRQLELIRPRFICCLGGTAMKYLLGTAKSLGSMRNKLHDFHGIPVVCTYHPAYLLPHRSPDPQTLQERKKMVWDDMKFLLGKMGRTIEKK